MSVEIISSTIAGKVTRARIASGRRSLAAARKANVRRLRLIAQVRAVYRLGDRAVFELVDGIATATARRSLVEHIVADFARIDGEMLRAVGGHEFPPAPTRLVSGGRQ